MVWWKFWQRIGQYRGQFILLVALHSLWVGYVAWLPLFYRATEQALLQHQLTQLDPLAYYTLTLTHANPLGNNAQTAIDTHLSDALAQSYQTVSTATVMCGEEGACFRLAGYDAFNQYLTVVAGRYPQSQQLSVVLEGMVSKTNAVIQGYQVGEVIQVGAGESLILIEIVGIVEPLDPADPFWQQEAGIVAPIETQLVEGIRPDLTVLLDWADFQERLIPSLATWGDAPSFMWQSYLELAPQVILRDGFNALYERIGKLEATLLTENLTLTNPLPQVEALHQQRQIHLLLQVSIFSAIGGMLLLLGLDLSLHALLYYENIDWQVLHQSEMASIRQKLHQRFRQVLFALAWVGVVVGCAIGAGLALPWGGYRDAGISLLGAILASGIGVGVVANGGYGKVSQHDRSEWVGNGLLVVSLVLLLTLLFNIGQVWWLGRTLDNGILPPFRAGFLALQTQPFGVAQGLGITLHATLTVVMCLTYAVGSRGLQRNPREYNQLVVRQTLSDWQSYWKNRLYTLMMGLTLTAVLGVGAVVLWNQIHAQLWRLAYQVTGADLRVSLVSDVNTDLVLNALPNVTHHSTLLDITEQERNTQPLRVLGIDTDTIQSFLPKIALPQQDTYTLSGGIRLERGVKTLTVDLYHASFNNPPPAFTLTGELSDWRGIPLSATFTPSIPPVPRQFIPYEATLPLGVGEPLMWHNLTLTPITDGLEHRVLLDALGYSTQTSPTIMLQGFEGEMPFVAPFSTQRHRVQANSLATTEGIDSLQVDFIAPISLAIAPSRWESIPLLMSEWLAFQQPPNGILSLRMNGNTFEIPYQRVGVVSGVFAEQERGIIATLDDLLPILNRQTQEGAYFVPNVALLSLTNGQASPSLRDVLQNHATLNQPRYAIDARQTLSEDPFIWVGSTITSMGALLTWCSWIITIGVNIRAMRQVGRVARFGLVVLGCLLIGGGIAWFYGGWMGWFGILNSM
ncbi:MAG: hypothetical protein ACOYLB_13885 [Phototrophicaceae bacterium]